MGYEKASKARQLGSLLRLKEDPVEVRQMPYLSIERTSQGLRPCAASHVKR